MTKSNQFNNVFASFAVSTIIDRFFESNKTGIGYRTNPIDITIADFFAIRTGGFEHSFKGAHMVHPVETIAAIRSAFKELGHPLYDAPCIFTGLSIEQMKDYDMEELKAMSFTWGMDCGWPDATKQHNHYHQWLTKAAPLLGSASTIDDAPIIAYIVVCDLLAVYSLHDSAEGWTHLRGNNVPFVDDVVATLLAIKEPLDKHIDQSVVEASTHIIKSICDSLPNNQFNFDNKRALIEVSRKLANNIF